MPVNTVKLTGQQAFSGTHKSGQKIYFRSDAAADDGNIYLYGKKSSDSNANADIAVVATNEGKIEHLVSTELSNIYLLKYATALTGNASFYSNNGTAATGSIHIASQPADGDTIEIGLTGFTKTFTFETGTITSNGHVYSESNLNKVAANLASAINDLSTGSPTAGEGTGGTYGWSNTDGANPYLTASVNGTTVTLTDKINCNRQLSWITTVSNASSLSICPIRGGVDGTKIVVDIYCQDPGASVTPVIQLSNDNTNWRDAVSTITDLDSDQQQLISGNDLFAEYARIKFTTWALTNPKSFNIKIITQG